MPDLRPSDVVLNKAVEITTNNSSSYDIGGVSSGVYTSKGAQSFTATNSALVKNIAIFVSKFGSPTDNLQVSLRGSRDGADLTSGVISGTSLTSSMEQRIISLNTHILLSSGTTYWVFLQRTSTASDSDNYRVYGQTGNTYASGEYNLGNAAGGWFVGTSDISLIVSSGGWADNSGDASSSSIIAAINETTPNDSTYIRGT